MSLSARTRIALFAIALLCCLLVACSDDCHHLHIQTQTVLPDCSHEGYTLNSCTDCGYEFKSNVIAPYGHTLRTEVSEPDCESEGSTRYVCGCGYTYVSNVVPPLGHDLQKKVIEPTCTLHGYSAFDCSRCNLYYESELVPPLGHDFLADHTAPTTCTATGHTSYTCQICDFSYIGDFLFYSDVFEGAYGASTEPLAHGVDISKYNHEKTEDGVYLSIDFVALREAGFDFVILKAGSTPRAQADGSLKGGPEPTFEEDYQAARAAGLDVGVYFYTYATTTEQALADAELLMTWIEGKTFEYPIYLDVEDVSLQSLSRREITDLSLTFLTALQQNRYFGAIYTNNNWLLNYLQTDKITFLLDVWYARYPSGEGPYIWDNDKYGENMGMWQYTQSGKIPSLSSALSFDLNYAYKDYPAIIAALGYNGLTPDP